MDNTITEFLDILKDNKYVAKPLQVDDHMDNADEIKAEIEEKWNDALESGVLPDSSIYFELNGCHDPEAYSEFLEKKLNCFKLAFNLTGLSDDENLHSEVKNQLSKIRLEIVNMQQDAKSLNNSALDELFAIKISFSKELNNFLQDHTISKKSIKRKKSNATSILTSNQIAILFYHLKETGVIWKEIPKTVYSKIISELTGYESEQIRQNLTALEPDRETFYNKDIKEKDFEKVTNFLEGEILGAIDSKNTEKFPPLE